MRSWCPVATIVSLFLFSACTPKSDTGDSTFFAPTAWSIEWTFGLAGGQATLATTSDHEALGPFMMIGFYEDEYLEAFDERFACYFNYTFESSPGNSIPNAWSDWSISPTLTSNTCENLNPSVWGSNPAEYYRTSDWEIGTLPLDADQADELANQFEDWGYRWEDYEPYTAGAGVYAGGSDFQQGEHHFVTWAWEVSDKMTVTSSYLTTIDIQAVHDGFYQVWSPYLMTTQ